ncbi:hypothetical protein DCO48_03155 [Pseudomonas sp. SDI]|uniref:hypothetical protein n=1 Tax=Pseudomonas sp. SDI TaxID=2170734 RepID=UPI000DE795A7|nr:hypothetical protein [Pseudomonas sp. SDI]PWB35479.1 hypothetical protein DCO48_03155 [Pseudomonas sp. SDI]
MVTHYSTNGSDSACGRTSPTLVSSADTATVSCKSCQRSLVKPEAAPVKKTPSLADLRKKPAATKRATPAANAGFCFKAGWHARLRALPNTCRLPRGVAGQAFV